MSPGPRFPDAVESVTQARHFVAEVLEGRAADDTSEAAQLMVSELAANSIRHAPHRLLGGRRDHIVERPGGRQRYRPGPAVATSP